ncbi:MAG: T9SS type A sorting domain-containing protein [Bacteroidia bacterium]|nr:T9SS type A sorting domain-containing protein [Bacteroidia bacterium]MCC6767779.1 T9SS type A sorting domain-containing protein [Bacteroidia bacterium]
MSSNFSYKFYKQVYCFFLKKAFIASYLCVLPIIITAQNTYTNTVYEVREEKNILYGTAINYAGNPVDLYLDLYKPVDDQNLHRPVVVIAFGGAWVTGSRASTDVTPLIPWFVKRGYVVASIDYRLGMHTSPAGGSNTATCSAMDGPSNCAYVADTSEFIRASFRAMQDMKGAIRFLKARSLTDSTCRENFYVAGVSAGGFTALAAAFMNDESEKPTSAGALPDAPTGAASLNYCHQTHNPPGADISLKRPDLGSIEGTIALNGENSHVQGVANFFGGMIWNFLENTQADDAPLLYLYHKTSDPIVPCGYTPLLAPLSYDCLDPFAFLGCKHIWNTPWAWGSCAIKNMIDAKGYPISYFNALKSTGGPNCLENPPGHSYQDAPKRVEEISNFFSPRIMATEQISCALVTGQTNHSKPLICRISPNPAYNHLYIHAQPGIYSCTITDLSGRLLASYRQEEPVLDVSTLNDGLYLLHYSGAEGLSTLRFIKTSH